MTNERAKQILEYIGRRLQADEAVALSIAYHCLEKQIPIKPTLIEDKMYMCPKCYNNLMFKWEKYPTILNSHIGLNYCLGCGQKLDWCEVLEQLKGAE